MAVPKSLPPRGRWHGASRDGRSGTAEPRKAGIDEKCAHARIFGVKCCTVERLCGIMIKTMKAAMR